MSRSVPCIFFRTRIAVESLEYSRRRFVFFAFLWLLCLDFFFLFLRLWLWEKLGGTLSLFSTITSLFMGDTSLLSNSNFVWIVDFVAWVSSPSERTPKFFLLFEIKILNCSASFAVTQGIFPSRKVLRMRMSRINFALLVLYAGFAAYILGMRSLTKLNSLLMVKQRINSEV